MQRPTHSVILAVALLASLASILNAQPIDWESIPFTSHATYQATDASGAGTFPMVQPIRMQGVWLHDSSEMLNPTPGATGYLGGMWQTFFQSVEPGDFGGTALWMGQYIGRITGTHPEGSYTDELWASEIDRLTHDPITGYEFQPGDLVEIRARAPGMHFRGKTNINEQHTIDPEADFDVYLIEAGYGLPDPAVITIADLKDASDAFIFDATRATGCEHYQATLVRINNVTLTDATGWAPDANLYITDGELTFPIKLGLGDGFSNFAAPEGPFDIVGILDQEDYDGSDGLMGGYRLWVCRNYDGNDCVVPGHFTVAGDANGDGLVSTDDVEPFITALTDPASFASLYACGNIDGADVDENGEIDGRDVSAFLTILLGS